MLENHDPFWSDIWEGIASPHDGLSRREARKCHEELLAALPRKIEYLRQWMGQHVGPMTGDPADDLELLGAMLCRYAKKRSLRQEERNRLLTQHESAPEWARTILEQALGEDVLDAPTVSMCHYVGYYFSEALRREWPGSFYGLVQDRRFADHNRTVLVPSHGQGWIETVRIVEVFCSRCLERERAIEEGGSLVDLYRLHRNPASPVRTWRPPIWVLEVLREGGPPVWKRIGT